MSAQIASPNRSSRARRPPWWVLVLLILVGTEAGVRLFTAGYRWRLAEAPHGTGSAADYTILCVGDSHAQGFGVDSHYSYPAQLERLLHDRWPDRHVRVINVGRAGYTSSGVLLRLKGRLEAVHPDLVLVTIGHNDHWNFREFNFSAVELPWPRRLAIRLDQWLSHSYLYRLAKLPRSRRAPDGSATHKTPPPAADAPRELTSARFLKDLRDAVSADPQLAEQLLEKPEETHTADWSDEMLSPWVRRALQPSADDRVGAIHLSQVLSEHGKGFVAQHLHDRATSVEMSEPPSPLSQLTWHMARREYDRALPLARQLVQDDPTNAEHYLTLATIQVDREAFDEAIVSATAALRLNPDLIHAYIQLAWALEGNEQWEAARDVYLQAMRMDASVYLPWQRLAGVFAHTGRIDEARRVWRVGFLQTSHPNHLVALGQSYPDASQGRAAMRALLDEARTVARHDAAHWEASERIIEQGVHAGALQRLLETNLDGIVREVSRHGARLGLLTYLGAPDLHKRIHNLNLEVNPVIREVAGRHPEVLLIDGDRALSERVAASPHELMNPDRHHLNADGYVLLTRVVLEALVRAEVLPQIALDHTTDQGDGMEDSSARRGLPTG